jgi:hemerythrin
MTTIDEASLPRLASAQQNDDHQVEAALINRCIKAAGERSLTLAALLTELVLHTRAHFAREVATMSAANYPLRLHHEDHERVLAELTMTVGRFEAEADHAALRRELSREVHARFITHVRTMDKAADQWLGARASPWGRAAVQPL